MEDGAEDIFTKTAANEMTIIEIANGSAIDLSCFKFRLPSHLSKSHFIISVFFPNLNTNF